MRFLLYKVSACASSSQKLHMNALNNGCFLLLKSVRLQFISHIIYSLSLSLNFLGLFFQKPCGTESQGMRTNKQCCFHLKMLSLHPL